MTIALTGYANGNEQTPCLKPDYKKANKRLKIAVPIHVTVVVTKRCLIVDLLPNSAIPIMHQSCDSICWIVSNLKKMVSQ